MALSNDEIELLKLLKLLASKSFNVYFFRQAFLWHIHGHQAPDRVRVTIVFEIILVMMYWVNQYCPASKDQNIKISKRLQVSLEAEDLDSPVSAVAWSEDGEAFALGEEAHHLVINIAIISVSIIKTL